VYDHCGPCVLPLAFFATTRHRRVPSVGLIDGDWLDVRFVYVGFWFVPR
jgi:hypothetical protein